MTVRPNMRRGSAASFVRILRVVQERAYIFLENFEVPFRDAAASPEQSRLLGALYAEVLNPDWVESKVRGYFWTSSGLGRVPGSRPFCSSAVFVPLVVRQA